MLGRKSTEGGESLPLAGGIALPVWLTIAVTVLMTAASVGSLLFPGSIYPTDEQRNAFLTNDVVNLVVGLPVMLVILWMVRRERLLGLVTWPGALMYVIYNYLAYIFGMPLSWVTIVNSVIVLLSLFAGISFIQGIDKNRLSEMLSGVGPRVVTSVVMLLFGAGFFVQAFVVVASFLGGNEEIARADVGVFFADLVVSVIWFASGLLLLLRKPLGFALSWGGMFGVVMLNVGLLIYLILQPILTNTPFEIVDLIVIAVFTLICTLPMILFSRALGKKQNQF